MTGSGQLAAVGKGQQANSKSSAICPLTATNFKEVTPPQSLS